MGEQISIKRRNYISSENGKDRAMFMLIEFQDVPTLSFTMCFFLESKLTPIYHTKVGLLQEQRKRISSCIVRILGVFFQKIKLKPFSRIQKWF